MFGQTLPLSISQIAPAWDEQALTNSNALVNELGISEWLGPLAPVALSPFFGLCVLSGIATYGPESLQAQSGLFHASSSLNSPILFWTMLVLALLTSLPRMTKVSKPLALAAENLETYSTILILIGVRMLGASAQQQSADAITGMVEPGASPVLLSAGFASVSLSVMLSLFAAVNVLVINAVKLFFEFAIWLIPFPAVDAILEVGNKSLCASLLAIYAYSPTLATILNLLMLVACAMVFGWTTRRLRYYREIVAGPVLAWLFPHWFAYRGEHITAFCETPMCGLPKLSPVRVERLSGSAVRLQGAWWWRRFERIIEPRAMVMEQGLVARGLILTDAQGTVYRLSHRRWVAADGCFESWGEAKLTGEAPAI